MRLIIIGASGLIGSQLHAVAKLRDVEVIGTYSGNARDGLRPFDMRTDSILGLVPDLGPRDVVYLLSAYSSPSWIFNNPNEARRLNLEATLRLAKAAMERGARLIFMSSVEVFDGKEGNYSEESTPAPLNLYGKLKYDVERALPTFGENYCIVRTGWNVGWDPEHRCVVKLTYDTLLSSAARMATDNTFSIADVRDTAKGLRRLADSPLLQKIHLASREIIRRDLLADAVISLSGRGASMRYSPTRFEDIPYSEPRARLNHLNASKATDVLGINFRPASDIIAEKVGILDQSAALLK